MNKPTFDAMAAQYALEQAKGEGSVQWQDGAHCVVPGVVIGGKAVQDGTPTPENPIMPVFGEGTTIRATNADGFDGGTAVAPELLAIPGTEYRDEWDAQTGRGVRRVYQLVLDGTEPWNDSWLAQHKQMVMIGIAAVGLPLISDENGMCNCGGSVRRSNAAGSGISLGSQDAPFVELWGIDNVADWKAYLADRYASGNPVIIWYPMREPASFQTDPQPLVQPKGDCNLIQTGGTLEDCPITAKYVTHS